MYHEKQCRQLCALHAINNLLQRPAVTQRHLDNICRQLAPSSGWMTNPHRSPLGTGNYDVNVLLAALQQHNLSAQWFDRRRCVSTIDCASVFGFVLNRPSRLRLGWLSVPVWRPHWLCVRAIKQASQLSQEPLFYDLDSKLAQPQLIGKKGDLLLHLREQLSDDSVQLFVVTRVTSEKDSARDSSATDTM